MSRAGEVYLTPGQRRIRNNPLQYFYPSLACRPNYQKPNFFYGAVDRLFTDDGMEIYFFDTYEADGFQRDDDDEGCECTGLEEARQFAKRALCEIAIGRCSEEDHFTYVVRVRDLTGAEVYTATLALAGAGPEVVSTLLHDISGKDLTNVPNSRVLGRL